MPNYKYKITIEETDALSAFQEKELVIEKSDAGSVTIKVSGEVIVRFWYDGDISLYEATARNSGFKPALI